MAVSMEDVKKLRDLTSAGFMDCKKALAEANGDFDEAVKLIRERGQAVAAKRSDREATEGCVLAGVNGNFAALVAIKCETDFVARNEDFINMTKTVLDTVLAAKPATAEEIPSLKVGDVTVQDLIIERSGVTGEKMESMAILPISCSACLFASARQKPLPVFTSHVISSSPSTSRVAISRRGFKTCTLLASAKSPAVTVQGPLAFKVMNCESRL